jgi:hypothetical protein
MQVLAPNWHTWFGGQGSLSSHIPVILGTQAGRQSAHWGQLEVPQASQALPTSQLSQSSPVHEATQVPLRNRHTMPSGQSM